MANYNLTHTGQELDEAIGKVLDDYLDTSDATAAAADVVSGKTAYSQGAKITGTHVCQSGSPTLQSKSVSPSESQQSVTPDEGYNGLSEVSVGAIASDYVGSGVARKSSSDLTASGGTVSVPAGYYASNASKSVSSGTQGTPSASKSISGHTATVTSSCTDTSGYIEGTTKTGEAVTVSASELVSGTKSVTENGTHDVTDYESVSVNVPAPEPTLQNKTVTVNGTYTADQGYDGLGEVTVNVQGGGGITVTKNLLDNWYFGNPVNSRGQSSYTTAGYSIDRWKFGSGTLTVNSGSITLTKTSGASYAWLAEYFPVTFEVGETLTMSAIVDGELITDTFTVPAVGTEIYPQYGSAEVYQSFGNQTGGNSNQFYNIYSESSSCTITAVKLERGSQQTLAHQEGGAWVLNEIPDYNEEKAKCLTANWADDSYTLNSTVIGFPATITAGDTPVLASSTMASTKNVTSMSATGVSIAITKAGTYRFKFSCARTSTSGTFTVQLYKNGSAVSGATATWSSRQGTCSADIACAAGDTIEIWAKSYSTSAYIVVGQLIACINMNNGF